MNTIFLYIAMITGLFVNDNPTLTINITNIASVKGNIVIGVFKNEETFLKEGYAINSYTIKVDKKTKQIVIPDLPKGEYAISLYHDENSDNECNRNFFGIPKEGYGFSNNIKPKLSAPSFKDCKFSLIENKVLDIALRN